MGILIVAATVWLLRGLGDVSENFLLREEIFNIGKLLVGTGVGITVLFLPFVKKPIMNYDPALLSMLHFIVRYFLPALAFLWITGGKTIKISYDFFESEDDRKVQVDSMISNLIPQKPTLNEMREEMFKMLFDEPGFQLFQEFLVKEFSVENIMFWKEAKDFREYASNLEARVSNSANSNLKPDEKDSITTAEAQQLIDTKALKIFKNFCADDANFLINIPYGIHNRLRIIFVNNEVRHIRTLTRDFTNKLVTKSNSRLATEREVSSKAVPVSRKINSDTFTEALNEVTNLMCSDSFRRFRMSDKYRKYVLNRYNREMDAIHTGQVVNATEIFISSSRASETDLI